MSFRLLMLATKECKSCHESHPSVCVCVCPQFDVVPVSPLQERLFLDAIELP